jgi:opacity protein-like surface antigen
MRRLLLAAFIAVVAQSAHAADPADLPILRGAFREPAPVAYRTVWQGYYVGGQVGYGASEMRLDVFSPDPSSSLIWPYLSDASHRATMFGGFVGYNAQYENVVLGFEANYMHGTFTGSSTAERSQTSFPDAGGNTLLQTFRSDGAMTVKDMGTLRVRGGYTMGSFMPYLFGGFAMGRADTLQSRTHTATWFNAAGVPSAPIVTTVTSDTNNQFVHGFAVGGGVDWMLFGGLYARAEYEYLQFTSSVNTSIHSVRGGLGYKF